MSSANGKEDAITQASDAGPLAVEAVQIHKVRGAIPAQVWVVSTAILFERAAFYGTTILFQNYLQNPRGDPTLPGALGLGQTRAITIIYVFNFYTYMTPLIGGILADCWLGRQSLIVSGLVSYMAGIAVLIATAVTNELRGQGGVAGFVIAGLLIGLGVGCTKPNFAAFMGMCGLVRCWALLNCMDQYVGEEVQTVKVNGGCSEMQVVSREVTIHYIYNINYWMTNVGGLSGVLTTLVERRRGFGAAFPLPLGFIIISTLVFLSCIRRYNTVPPAGNNIPLAALRAIAASATRSSRSSAALAVSGPAPDPTDTPRAQIVDNSIDFESLAQLKRILSGCLIFIPFIPLRTVMDLANSSLISQAGQMQTGGLPNDLLYNLNPIAVMILLPLLQGVVYPLLQGRFGISISPERRIIAGLVCAAISMGYAAGVQALVYAAGPCYSHPRHCDRDGAAAPPNDVSVWLQTPTYVFFALCEILTLVAGLELAYLRAPPSMKSIVQAVFILFSAAGAVVGVGVSFVAADPNMHILYASLAGAMLATASSFLVFVLAKGRRPNST